MKIKLYLIFVILAVLSLNLYSQSSDKEQEYHYKNSLELSPISPLVNIYGIQYLYQVNDKDELIAGLSYMKIKYDFGNTNASALILGYRRYLWKNLHIEYQLWPTYDNFYEKIEDKYYQSFDIWNEFRLGYQFDFNIGNIPFYSTLQWPFGFGLYAGNKPESFKDFEQDNRFFYQYPLIFIGIKF
ncbi:MAG: hypothetical protein K9M99_02935 [Candidatus Cloacimonetes bacterium]|nr:hypothetical protein [Candidatus Cloacimonadota bacterium]